MTTLSKPLIVIPAVEAVTVTTFDLVDVQENYGYSEEGTILSGRGTRNSVIAQICFPTTPVTTRNLIVWEGDEYLAVRGSWTDDTLRARIAEILEAE